MSPLKDSLSHDSTSYSLIAPASCRMQISCQQLSPIQVGNILQCRCWYTKVNLLFKIYIKRSAHIKILKMMSSSSMWAPPSIFFFRNFKFSKTRTKFSGEKYLQVIFEKPYDVLIKTVSLYDWFLYLLCSNVPVYELWQFWCGGAKVHATGYKKEKPVCASFLRIIVYPSSTIKQ